MCKKYLLSVIVSFSLLTSVFSQYKANSLANGILPAVIPSSPEASALGKFGIWPVSQYTGLPGISIPIYNVSIGGFQLPVQLSYHAGGVKLDEVASWVGNGWALNASGVISRSIVGLPDETNPGGFLYRNLSGNGLKDSYDVNDVDDYIFFRKVDDRIIDVEPDIFNYNFGGFSGKFYFDKTGQFQCVPVNSLKLLRCPVNNTLNYTDQHWEIADLKGNVFFFASYQENDKGFERTKLYTQDAIGALPPQVSAWYLTKIVLANNADVIYFDYNDKFEIYDLPNNYAIRKITDYYGYPYPTAPGGISNIDINGGNGSPNSLSTSGKSQLSKIRWSNGEVVFSANTARLDLTGGKMLDLVTVNNKEGQRLKQFALNYNYWQQRYFLTSLVEFGKDASVQLKHNFEYIQPESLPLRSQALAQDHWGYFNGALSNINLIPPVPEINSPALNANREPDETYMQYGALSKIIYPTGGYTVLDYEAHRYDPVSAVGRGNPPAQLTNTTITVKAGEPQPSGYNKTQNFNIPITQNISGISIQFTNYNKPASKQQARLPLAKIEKLVNGVYQQVYYWDAYDRFPVGNAVLNANGFVDFSITETASLDPGDYRILTDVVCGVSNCGTPSVNPGVTVVFTYASSNGQLPIAGGLRIKQLTNYAEGSFASAKRFTYAPGKLMIYPKYIHQFAADISNTRYCVSHPQETNGCVPCSQLYAKYLEVTSSSQAILGVTQGSIVGYTYVKEQDVNQAGEDNGFTDYTFDFTPDALNIVNYNSFFWSGLLNSSIPLTNLDYKRGALLFKDSYKKVENGTYVKVHSLRNDYQYNDNNPAKRYNSLRGLRINYIKRPGVYCANYVNGYPVPSVYPFSYDFTFGFYDIITGWVQNVLTQETVYDANGQNPMRTTTTYTYDNPVHLQATSVSVKDSKDRDIVTENKYPSDFATQAPAATNVYNSMVDRNMIAEPVYQKSSIGSSILSETKTDYQYWSGNSVIKPGVINSSIIGNTLEPRILFTNYDSKGNVLELQKTNDVKNVYLWGYKGQYPVAKVMGSTIGTVAGFVDQTVLDNLNGTYNDQQIRDELNKIRTGLAGNQALVTTYTYAPLIGMTSETDPAGKTTFYEYDGFNRLKNIKDYQGNIVKNFQYNYANGCGANCVVLTLQTFTGYNTPGYPVGVFNGNKQYIGIANNPTDYVNLWNSNSANQALGVLSTGADALHFNLSLATNATPPPVVFGLRFYEWVGFMQNKVDIGSDAFSFIDWGDGSKELLSDLRYIVATTLYYNYVPNLRYESFCYGNSKSHTYSTNQPRTIRVFHNETTEWVSFAISGAEDFTQTPNITGYYPERVKSIAYNNITNSSDVGVLNFNSLTDVVHCHYQFYTSATTRHNNWQSINNFHKLKWLKLAFQNGAEVGSNFRVNFPELRYFETQSFKPDIAQIFSGPGFPNAWAVIMGVQPNTITSAEIDAILIKQAADGTAINGFMGFLPTPQRSTASNTSFATLIAGGWDLHEIASP